MGYWTNLTLVNVQIHKKLANEVKLKIIMNDRIASNTFDMDEVLCPITSKPDSDTSCFWEDAMIYDENGDGKRAFLGFKPDSDDPFDTYPMMKGKWYSIEAIAHELKKYCKSGLIVLHSLEGDGAAFGYEFNGKGQMRLLGLLPYGKWK